MPQQQEMDWEQAKLLLKFFAEKGHDIGESSALELYAALQKASSEGGGKFVVMICDGIEKYKKNLASIGQEGPMQVSLQEANAGNYDKVIWIHAQYTPLEQGIELIAKSLGIDKSKICCAGCKNCAGTADNSANSRIAKQGSRR